MLLPVDQKSGYIRNQIENGNEIITEQTNNAWLIDSVWYKRWKIFRNKSFKLAGSRIETQDQTT